MHFFLDFVHDKGCTDGQTDGQTDRRTDRQTDEHLHENNMLPPTGGPQGGGET